MAHLVEEFGFRLSGHCWTRLHRSGSTVSVCSPCRERAECSGRRSQHSLGKIFITHLCSSIPRLWAFADSSEKKLQKAAWSGLKLFIWMAAVKRDKKRHGAA